jgi:hypothetical protein
MLYQEIVLQWLNVLTAYNGIRFSNFGKILQQL